MKNFVLSLCLLVPLALSGATYRIDQYSNTNAIRDDDYFLIENGGKTDYFHIRGWQLKSALANLGTNTLQAGGLQVGGTGSGLWLTNEAGGVVHLIPGTGEGSTEVDLTSLGGQLQAGTNADYSFVALVTNTAAVPSATFATYAVGDTNCTVDVYGTFTGAGATNTYSKRLHGILRRAKGTSTFTNLATTDASGPAGMGTNWDVSYACPAGTTIGWVASGATNEEIRWSWTGKVQLVTNAVATVGGGGGGNVLDLVTNQVGYTPLAFYLPSATTYTTNSTPTLADISPLGQANNMTNLGAASSWPVRQVAALNGHDTLAFNGSSAFLRCDKLTNGQPYEITLVMRWNAPTNSSTRYIWVTTNTAAYASQSSAGKHVYRGFSSTLTGSDVRTNQWMLWTYYSDASNNGYALTNRVVDVSGNSLPTPKLLQGLIFGGTGGNFSPIELGAAVIYPTNLTTTVRSNVCYGLADYFGISLP